MNHSANKHVSIYLLFLFFVFCPALVLCEDLLSCTIEKSLRTGPEEPLTNVIKTNLEAKPFGKAYAFSLSPASGECELRAPSPNGGTFLNCWTADKKYGFYSDRSNIREKATINTLTFADGEKGFLVRVTAKCK